MVLGGFERGLRGDSKEGILKRGTWRGIEREIQRGNLREEVRKGF